MSEIVIAAETRTEFGKGAARRIRRAHQVPAVLYGHGSDPVHVALPGHELMLALKQPNVLLSIAIGSESHLAIPKQVQRDPLKGFIEHADFQIVKRGEKAVVEVPIVLIGEAVAGTLVVTENPTLSVEAEATHLPSEIEVSIDGLDAGDQVVAGGITLPKGTTLAVEADALVVNVTAAPTADEVEAELAEAEAEAGIEHDAPASETGSTEGDSSEGSDSE